MALGLIALLRSRQVGTLPNHLRLPVIQLKCFTKHVYGYNSYFDDEHFDFKYDNEWRFVPTIKQIKGNRISVDFSKYNKNKKI
ncbi:MAG: abortive infection system antitoxin AbiGi family protein [Candidatus Arsenophonus phytopathogenicus]